MNCFAVTIGYEDEKAFHAKHKYNLTVLFRIITLSIMCEDTTKENGREYK